MRNKTEEEEELRPHLKGRNQEIKWPNKLEYFSINCLETFLQLQSYPKKLRKLTILPIHWSWHRDRQRAFERAFEPENECVTFGGNQCNYKILEFKSTQFLNVLSNYHLPSCVQKLVVPYSPGILSDINLPRTLNRIQVTSWHNEDIPGQSDSDSVTGLYAIMGISGSNLYDRRKWSSSSFHWYPSLDKYVSTITFTGDVGNDWFDRMQNPVPMLHESCNILSVSKYLPTKTCIDLLTSSQTIHDNCKKIYQKKKWMIQISDSYLYAWDMKAQWKMRFKIAAQSLFFLVILLLIVNTNIV